jgi:lipopolysaccharide assembly outer membrane protein LptD (OstA)
MNKKVLFQIFLISVIFFITFLFYNFYFSKKKINTSSDIPESITSDTSSTVESNYIHNIEYISQDSRGNEFIIKSKTGVLVKEQMNNILLSGVTAEIRSLNSPTVFIRSDKAIYNNSTYDTNFYQNVIVKYENHKITSDKLDLIFSEDMITSYDNVIYNNLTTKLKADKVIVDLITKDSKIFMYNKKNKINIINKQ